MGEYNSDIDDEATLERILEKSERYDVVIGSTELRIGMQYRNLVYRGRVKFRRQVHLWFEAPFTHVLVQAVDVRQCVFVPRRYAL